MYLSKSDFKIAQSCPTKLYYKKRNYPTSNDSNEYLEYLAEGGYAIGKLATFYYPDGIQIDTHDQSIAISDTIKSLAEEQATLFEATIESNGKIAAIDILEKQGASFNLIEVKSKGYSQSDGLKGFDEHIVDITFQYLVLSEAYPEAQINTYLFVPDKDKSTEIEGLNGQFQLKKIDSSGSFRSFEVMFTGDKEDVVNDNLLIQVDVTELVLKLIDDIKNDASIYLNSLRNNKKIKSELSKKCFNCEYNVEDQKSGYNECWTNYIEPEHHIKDLYYAGSLGNNQAVNDLISEGKISLFDVDESQLINKRGIRQKIQLEHIKTNTEWLSSKLQSELNSWKYPLHFIDFETCITALPFHKGMKPYEMSAFQWSCHTIEYEGAEPKHAEWINVEPKFPSFKFAESLMKQIGSTGTVLMWSSHENTTLKNIYKQMNEYGYSNVELKIWLEYMIKFKRGDDTPLVDMNKVTVDHYFHPLMKGRTSIKVTLPAVLESNRSDRTIKWLREFDSDTNLLSTDERNIIENPYKNLPSFDLIDKAEQVADGTGAMTAYADMLFGLHKDSLEIKQKYQEALLKYCKLDTLAMVIIWEHWMKG